MKQKTFFRSWYYFRTGWSLYFAFIMAALNTLTVTYFLAIERVPSLTSIFPNFIQYVIIIALVGVPILVIIGYSHFKISHAQREEASVYYEANPLTRRNLINSEITLILALKVSEMLITLSNDEKLSKEQVEEIKKIIKKYVDYNKERKLSSEHDISFLKKMYG